MLCVILRAKKKTSLTWLNLFFFFHVTGALRYIRTLKPWPLKRVMVEKYLFSEADSALLCDFLDPMLAIDMRERTHARDMKNHRWLEPTRDDVVVTEW